MEAQPGEAGCLHVCTGNIGFKWFQNKVSSRGGEVPKLSQVETEILSLLTAERLRPDQIAIRRKTSIQATNKIIRKLKEKGAYSPLEMKVSKNDGTLKPLETIRLHAENFLIRILYKQEQYKDLEGKSIILDSNTVRFHRDVICIYSNQSFFGIDTWAATAKAVTYWNAFLRKLECQYGIILIKPRAENIERTRAEYAQIRNGLAIKMEREHDKIRIRAREDGKIWFEIDNSFDLREAETKHPRTAEMDMQEAVEPFFNDLRDMRSYLPSDVKQMIDGLVQATANLTTASTKIDSNVTQTLELLKTETQATTLLAENIRSHIPAWMSNVDNKREMRKIREILSQRSLKGWI